jgi:5-formyltetrahydrofolate cyclo-ligase
MMRAARRALPAGVGDANAHAVATRALDLLDRCGSLADGRILTIGATIAHDGELDPAPLVDALLERGARVAYARVVDDVMGFALVGSARDLSLGPGAVLQPPDDAPAVAPHELDVVLVPVVAFDASCERVGRGGGHYDQTFARRDGSPPLLVGLAHDEQRVGDVAPAPHDVALDHVVTPTTVFSRRDSREAAS